MTTLQLDPSRPYQTNEDLLAIWLPRGRGRDDRAAGLAGTVDVCDNRACLCTEASLNLARIDDRAVNVTRQGDRFVVNRQNVEASTPFPSDQGHVLLDLLTGVVETREKGAVPAFMAPFCGEPLPFWVLDHFWARWCAPRLPSGSDWRSQAQDQWEPDTMLSTMLVWPDDRPDRYVVDGKVYQVDTLFCAKPRCDCVDARLSVFAVSEDGRGLSEVASARLPPDSMVPIDLLIDELDKATFARIYLAWRGRNVPARERLLELRDRTRQRGAELYRSERARVQPAPSRPGRNAPCPCGSGRKFKKCCGA